MSICPRSTNPIGMRKQAARVFIPVRSVTVAEPPKINMEETIMFVAMLKPWLSEFLIFLRLDAPKKHEHEMSRLAPTSSYDFEPGVSMRSIQLQFCWELLSAIKNLVNFSERGLCLPAQIAEPVLLHRSHTTMDRWCHTCKQQHWIAAAWRLVKVMEYWTSTNKGRGPSPSRDYTSSN